MDTDTGYYIYNSRMESYWTTKCNQEMLRGKVGAGRYYAIIIDNQLVFIDYRLCDL